MPENTWRDALDRTRKAAFGRLFTLAGRTELNSEFWDELEGMLVQADIGVTLTTDLLAQLKSIVRQNGFTHGSEAISTLKELLLDSLGEVPRLPQLPKPAVLIVIGVNGSGKTTSVAKLAHHHQKLGRNVILAAADTYRAAATEQLQIWGTQLGCDVISGQFNSDPAAVVYDAAQATLARSADLLIVDTSGRMHTAHNLMSELEKICRVSGKVIPDAPHQVLLVMDATTGQNGLSQARSFVDKVAVDSVLLAKLDGSSKGGIGFAIVTTIGIPILYVGLGERLEDLQTFNPAAYIDGLFPMNDFLSTG